MFDNVIIPSLQILVILSLAAYMWSAIIRDLAQIRAAQKIEVEAIVRLAKLLDEDKKDE